MIDKEYSDEIYDDISTIYIGDYAGEDTMMTTYGTNVGNITITSGGTGGILSGSNGYTYDDYIITSTMPQGALKVNGDAEFEGDLKIKGKSLVESIENIEKRLAILHPNSELESRWNELKELGEKYRQLEKEILEKESIWETLKK